jgi:hypothetical protein
VSSSAILRRRTWCRSSMCLCRQSKAKVSDFA